MGNKLITDHVYKKVLAALRWNDENSLVYMLEAASEDVLEGLVWVRDDLEGAIRKHLYPSEENSLEPLDDEREAKVERIANDLIKLDFDTEEGNKAINRAISEIVAENIG